MAQNFIAPGDIFKLTAAAVLTSGQPVAIGDLLGVALGAAAIGEDVSVAVEGVFSIAKRTHATTAAMPQGSPVYWVTASNYLDNTSNTGANKLAGYAYETAASTAPFVKVRLLG